jgi:chromosome segregation ATPase
MSASDQARAGRLDNDFWDRLERLEGCHQQVQLQHELARRRLDRLSTQEAEEIRSAWRHYCEVIAELDRTAAEFEALRT